MEEYRTGVALRINSASFIPECDRLEWRQVDGV